MVRRIQLFTSPAVGDPWCRSETSLPVGPAVRALDMAAVPGSPIRHDVRTMSGRHDRRAAQVRLLVPDPSTRQETTWVSRSR